MRETGLTNNDWQTSTRQNTTKTQGSNVRHAQWSNFLPAAHQGKRKKQPLSRKMCGEKKTSERSFKSVKWNKSRKKTEYFRAQSFLGFTNCNVFACVVVNKTTLSFDSLEARHEGTCALV